ncbi:ECF transporter S component [candidate division WOR-3 bacterium]|nr:ECF transporter S component [candidate division WOR-3 bacterium]
MSNYNERVISIPKPTLEFHEVRAFLLQGLLVTTAILLPAVAHLLGVPVRILLPMHWPIILAGLVYGWRGGALTGLLAPILSFLISGRPLPIVLPAMTIELFAYGFFTGLFRERFRWNPIASVAVALILGRVAFIIAAVLSGYVNKNYLEYLKVALIPGFAAATAQIILLPLLGSWWVKKGKPDYK